MSTTANQVALGGNTRADIQSIKRWLYETIHDSLGTKEKRSARIFNVGMLGLIFVNVLAVVFETEPDVYSHFTPYFHVFEVMSVAIFAIEYLLRLWVCTLDERYRGAIRGRLRFMLSPLALIDLLAILPFFVPLIHADLRIIRSVRLFRVLRLLKMGRYSQTLNALVEVMRTKKEELLVTAFSGSILLIIASSLMYFAERNSQPEVFASIPSAMWWGVTALASVSYGDIYPKTVLGKVLAGLIGVLGVGMLALPAGILASGFTERIARRPRTVHRCPYCKEEFTEDDERRKSQA